MNIQAIASSEQAAKTFPSLSFQVDKNRCSITARCVSSIILMPEQIVSYPEAPAYCKGVIDLRGQVIPLVDTRTLFGLPTLEQEYADFCAMLDARKQDHVKWVKELERCIEQDASFPLAVDHHLCALGKWCDSFHSENSALMFHLHKLDDPHQRLHVVARHYNECREHRTDCGQDAQIQRDTEMAGSQYMPTILKLLNEAKEIFYSSYQAIVIILEGTQGMLGLIVDQVFSVDAVTAIDEDHSSYFSQTRFISGIGKSEKAEQSSLILNDRALLDLCQGLQY